MQNSYFCTGVTGSLFWELRWKSTHYVLCHGYRYKRYFLSLKKENITFDFASCPGRLQRGQAGVCVKRMSGDFEEGNWGNPEERDGTGGDHVLFVLQGSVVISTRVSDGGVVVVVIYSERAGYRGRVIVGAARKPDKTSLIFTARPPLQSRFRSVFVRIRSGFCDRSSLPFSQNVITFRKTNFYWNTYLFEHRKVDYRRVRFMKFPINRHRFYF